MHNSENLAHKIAPLGKSVLFATAATFALPHLSYAQSESAQGAETTIEEILVTARKREENLQDIPIAITAVTAEEMINRGINDLRDLSRFIPSVTFDRSITQGDFRPAIRGLQAETGRTSVGLLIDGIDVTGEALQSSGGGFLVNPGNLDIDRVEVVKGPQAALYGRAAFGGAINYISKRPSLTETEYMGSGEATDQGGFRGKGGISVPAIDGKLGVRLFGYYYDERGAFRNEKSGDYVGGSNGAGATLSLLASPSEDSSLFFTLSYSDESFDPQAAFLVAGTTVVTPTANQAKVIGAGPRTIFTGKVQPQAIFYDLDPKTNGNRDYPGADSEKFRGALIGDWDLGPISIRSLSSFINMEYSAYQDNDFVTFPAGELITGAVQETERGNTTQQFSQEISLQSNSEGPLQWTVGGLYWNESVAQYESNDTGLAFGPISEADRIGFFNEVNQLPRRFFNRDTEHFSVYGFAEYDFTDKLSVSVEGRYVSETIDYDLNQPDFIFFYGVIASGVDGEPNLLTVAAVDAIDRATVEEDYFIPKLTLSYQANDDMNFYASVGTGVKPGGFNTGGVILFDDSASYKREDLTAYELGAKTNWLDGTLQINVAGFLQKYENQQVRSQIFREDLQQLGGVIENAGKSTIWGLEFEAAAQPTEHLTLSLAYTYLNAEFDEFKVLSNSASRIMELPDCTAITFAEGTDAERSTCELDRSGLSPADLPEHRAVGRVVYRNTLTEDIDWFVDGTVMYTGERFAETSNVVIQSAATTVDLIGGIEQGNWRVALFARNLFDNDNVTDAQPYINFQTGFTPSAFGYLADPRTIGIRGSFTY